MKAKLTDLKNQKWVRGDFKISLTSNSRKDDDGIQKLVTSLLEDGNTEVALEYSTDGSSGVIYLECV